MDHAETAEQRGSITASARRSFNIKRQGYDKYLNRVRHVQQHLGGFTPEMRQEYRLERELEHKFIVTLISIVALIFTLCRCLLNSVASEPGPVPIEVPFIMMFPPALALVPLRLIKNGASFAEEIGAFVTTSMVICFLVEDHFALSFALKVHEECTNSLLENTTVFAVKPYDGDNERIRAAKGAFEDDICFVWVAESVRSIVLWGLANWVIGMFTTVSMGLRQDLVYLVAGVTLVTNLALYSPLLSTDEQFVAADDLSSIAFYYITPLAVSLFSTKMQNDLHGAAYLQVRYISDKSKRLARQASFHQDENIKLKKNLAEATKIVKQVMAEGGSILRSVKIDHSKLEILHPLGEGAFGTVQFGYYKGEQVAIKTVRTTKVTQSAMRAFMSEVQIMAPLHHENIVHLYGGCWDSADELCIVVEFCPRGTLRDLLDRASHAGYTWMHPFEEIVLGIARCFVYLHHELKGEELIHRDLKPANIFITDNMTTKVGDFGEARRMETEATLDEFDVDANGDNLAEMTLVGTPMYIAPEVTLVEPYNFKVDVYAFSIILLEVICISTGSVADFVARQLAHVTPLHIAMNRKAKPSDAASSSKLMPLIRKAWSHESAERPSFTEILETLKGLKGNIFSETTWPTSKLDDVEEVIKSSTEISDAKADAMRKLHHAICANDERWASLPSYIGGGYAMQRFLARDEKADFGGSYVDYCKELVDLREKHDQATKASVIRDRNLSLNSLPGSELMTKATWEINGWIGVDSQKDLIRFERFGAVNPEALLNTFTLEQYNEWDLYYVEALAMTLDVLSRRSRRMVRFSYVIDTFGVNIARHRKLIDYMKAFSDNEAKYVVPPLWKATYFVRSSPTIKILTSLIKAFMSEGQKNGLVFVAGNNPFQTKSFSMFIGDPRALPSTLGGELKHESDVNCCKNVTLPAACDAEQIWMRYQGQVQQQAEYKSKRKSRWDLGQDSKMRSPSPTQWAKMTSPIFKRRMLEVTPESSAFQGSRISSTIVSSSKTTLNPVRRSIHDAEPRPTQHRDRNFMAAEETTREPNWKQLRSTFDVNMHKENEGGRSF